MDSTTKNFLKGATPEQLAGFFYGGVISEEDYKKALKENKGETEKWLDRYITLDKELIEMKNRCRKLASAFAPVLIQGETGTGKELIARALHGEREGQFIPMNCAGIPDTLLESELFGSVVGAFTGAKNKTGLMEQAKDGTLFLDEIGEMPIDMQAKILRAIQEKKIRKLGHDIETIITCRIVSASHIDFAEAIATKKFREDLYFRLSTFVLRTKPMRIRSVDIKPIVEELDEEAKIKDLDWFCSMINPQSLKGNVRSLQQIVERYLILGELPTEYKI
jgi:transcriptional regulator with PAS, ATPase and Fis domain